MFRIGGTASCLLQSRCNQTTLLWFYPFATQRHARRLFANTMEILTVVRSVGSDMGSIDALASSPARAKARAAVNSESAFPVLG